MATKGAIVLVGDNARLTANTGATTSSGTVALGVQGSKLNSGDSARGGSADTGTAARQQPTAARSNQRSIGHENATLAELAKGAKGAKGHRGTALSGFEDHSVSVLGDDQIITYDDSNVFIDRKGEINANTGDTDSSGLNAVDVGTSTVRAGNSGDSEGVEAEESPAEEVAEEAASPATSMDENRLSGARVAPPTAQDPDDAEENEGEEAGVGPAKGQAFGTVTDEGATTATGRDTFAVGADGYDDVSIRSHGRNDIVTYDDSNVTIGGEGKVNAQIGDSDTGGAVVMGIQGSDARAGCEGDLCYSANPAIKLAAQLLGPSGVKLTMKQWQQPSTTWTRSTPPGRRGGPAGTEPLMVRTGWLIGRVLFAVPPHDGTVGDHPSPAAVADTPPATYPRARADRPRTLAVWSCSRWGLPSRDGHPPRWWSLAPPFHPYLLPRGRRRSVLCGTDPAGCPGWVLPTTSSCGARTFLDTVGITRGDAVARPARPRAQG